MPGRRKTAVMPSLGVWLGGAVYESTGSYDAMWWVSIVLSLAAAAVHLPIHERRGVGAERGVSARRHALVVLLLTLAASGGAAYQASAATEDGAPSSGLRLVCPLH